MASTDDFIRRFYLILAVSACLVIAPVAALWIYLDSRLNSLAADLQYRPPDADQGAVASLDELPWEPVQGQTVYVPAYSHIYHQNGKPQLLTVTLSVRNTDLEHEIVLTSVRYYDTRGQEVKSHIARPLRLRPLASTEFVVERADTSGGSGANFIVEWSAGRAVNEPVIEAVMIDTLGNQGISFVRPGTVIHKSLPGQSAETQSDQ